MSEESISFSSESSSGSHNQSILMFRKDKDDFSPQCSPSHRLSRTGTVKRTGGRLSLPDKNIEDLNQCVPECFKSPEKVSGCTRRERYRRSLDATYRRSLDSISEYKPRRSFSSCLVPSSSRECSSIDSSSSDYTDYTQHRSVSKIPGDLSMTYNNTTYLNFRKEYYGFHTRYDHNKYSILKLRQLVRKCKPGHNGKHVRYNGIFGWGME
ncbi:uncharacterized protein LOC108741027 [Agrilus planipennis]|uniref:Uncharacterized protein LOC108741027 n=1 Tax=Agrilus planipennis TaxID=224129 RepID=A0A1W4X4V4_AGRPL|nr:uncharacterized protein LOC108741027 [Agrilus planipennis]